VVNLYLLLTYCALPLHSGEGTGASKPALGRLEFSSRLVSSGLIIHTTSKIHLSIGCTYYSTIILQSSQLSLPRCFSRIPTYSTPHTSQKKNRFHREAAFLRDATLCYRHHLRLHPRLLSHCRARLALSQVQIGPGRQCRSFG